MLVLTTMFINVSNNLPKTSYVKMIDIWLIFNLLLPFIEVLVHTYMDSLRFKQNPSSVKNIPRNQKIQAWLKTFPGMTKTAKSTTMVAQ